jgi:hypothetical protein
MKKSVPVLLPGSIVQSAPPKHLGSSSVVWKIGSREYVIIRHGPSLTTSGRKTPHIVIEVRQMSVDMDVFSRTYSGPLMRYDGLPDPMNMGSPKSISSGSVTFSADLVLEQAVEVPVEFDNLDPKTRLALLDPATVSAKLYAVR